MRPQCVFSSEGTGYTCNRTRDFVTGVGVKCHLSKCRFDPLSHLYPDRFNDSSGLSRVEQFLRHSTPPTRCSSQQQRKTKERKKKILSHEEPLTIEPKFNSLFIYIIARRLYTFSNVLYTCTVYKSNRIIEKGKEWNIQMVFSFFLIFEIVGAILLFFGSPFSNLLLGGSFLVFPSLIVTSPCTRTMSDVQRYWKTQPPELNTSLLTGSSWFHCSITLYRGSSQ